MLIVYDSGDEVLVTTPENEAKVLQEYFDKGGRSLDDYDRTVCEEAAVQVRFSLRVS